VPSLGRRAATLLTGETTARLLGLLLYAVLARRLGVAGFGILSFGMTIALIAVTVIDLGQATHAARTVASAPAEARSVLRVLFTNKVLLGITVVGLVAAGVRGVGFGQTEVVAALMMVVWAVGVSIFDSERAILRSLKLVKSDAMGNSLESLLRVVVVVAFAFATGSAVGASVGFVLEAGIAVLAITAFLLPKTEASPSSSKGGAWQFLRDSAAIGVGAAGLAVFYRVDQAFVAGIAGLSATGLYAAASRIAFAGNVAAQIVVAAAYPELAAAHEDAAEYSRVLRDTLRLALLASAVIAATMALLAGPLVWIVYGSAYSESVGLLRVLSLTVLLNGVTAVGLYSAVALRRERRSTATILVLTPLVVVGYFFAVHSHGALGAAWVSVGAEAAISASLLFLSRDRFRATERTAD
jgi:lipopolysaccharide exporter